MKTPHFRARMRRSMFASVQAAVLIFALVLMQSPAIAVAQEESVGPTPEETTETVVAADQQVPADPPANTPPEGLTDDTTIPTETEPAVPTEPKETVETPAEPEEPVEPPTEPEASEARMVLLAAPDELVEDQCVIVSDETTLEGGSNSFELTGPYHTSWTAIVDALAKWIWGDSSIVDPVNETTQTFTKTFSIENDASGAMLVIAADNSYTVTLDTVEIASSNEEDNYHDNKVDTYNVDGLEAGTHTLTFTVKNWAMVGGTTAKNPAGLKYKLTVHGSDCGKPDIETATIVAQKIVCPLESDLPDWGDGDADITEDTAADFLELHPSCHLQPDWEFEWVTDANSNTNPGDNVEVAGAPWTLFGPTDEDGSVATSIPAGGTVWVREVLKDGFIPFTGQNTDQHISAEIYCSTDVLHYDNWERIDSVEAGKTYHCVAFNVPKTSTVKMCKVNTEQQPLSGWTLSLMGDAVGSVDVQSDGDDYSIEDVAPGNYVLRASGQYVYRPGDVNASTSDAAFSLRLPGDAVYGGTYAPWVRVNNFPSPYTGWLGLMLNNEITDWGSVFNPNHEYTHATSTDVMSDFVFTILDDVYNDNSGHLTVDVNKGYTGVTGQDGCVTFSNVPYGTYTAAEIMQSGWTNVSGLGKVTVDGPNETFTVVNSDNSDDGQSSITIVKQSMGGTGTFSIQVKEKPPVAPEFFDWTASITTTEAGVASSSTAFLPPDTYVVEETVPEGWDFTSVSCTGEEAGTNPLTVTVSQGEDVVCTFVNTKEVTEPEPTQTYATTTVRSADLADDIAEALTNWFFYNDQDGGSDGAEGINNVLGSFVEGPGASFGEGSAQIEVSGDKRRNLATYQFAGTKLADITALKYSTYNASATNPGSVNRSGYLQFNVSFDGNDTWQRRLTHLPSQNGSVTQDSWQEWDAINGGTALWSWSGYVANDNKWPDNNPNEYRTWNDIKTAFPNAEIRDTDSFLGIRVGEPYTDGYVENIDKFVIGIKTGLNTHTTTFDFEPTETVTEIDNTNRRGGGGGGGNSTARRGEVLGASTAACEVLLSTFMRMGAQNDTTEVVELQGFLNEHMGAMLPLTGVFGPMTDAAVHAFQKKYWEEVLKPWFPYQEAGIADEDDSTGYVYKTTQWKINDIVCPGLIPFPALP